MPPTRQTPDPPYDHVLKLLGYDKTTNPDHPVRMALRDESYDSFVDLFSLTRPVLETLQYTSIDEDGTPRKYIIPKGHQTRLLALQGYRCHFEKTNGRSMGVEDWMEVTVDEINEYRLSGDYMYFNNSDGSTSVPTTSPAVRRPKPGLEAFKKTIKRDPNLFKPFSDKRLWATWHLHFVATARAQDLQDVLDPSYVPTTADDIDVFQAKNEYLFSVFVDKLHTDEGKTLVRRHSKAADAQTIFTELCEHHTKSTHAELNASTILTFLTTFKLGRERWKGKTTASFISYYVEQLRLYDELTYGRSPPLPDDFKRTSLDAAVQAIDDLRNVRTTQSTLCQQLGQTPTFSAYLELLETAAMIYDDHLQHSATRRTDDQRLVYSHEQVDAFSDIPYGPGPITHYGYDGDNPGNEPFHVDVPLNIVNAFATQHQRPVTRSTNLDPTIRLPDSLFAQLNSDDKRTWSRFGADARRLILGLNPSTRPTANLHDSLGTAGISSVSRRVLQAEHVESSLNRSPPNSTTPADDSQLLAMITQRRSTHHPRDLRRLLSTSEAAYGTTVNPSIPVLGDNTTSGTQVGENIDAADGQRYRRIHVAQTYSVANAKGVHVPELGPPVLVDTGNQPPTVQAPAFSRPPAEPPPLMGIDVPTGHSTPHLNVPRRDEDLLTDVVYSATPAVDDGSTSAAIYSGKKSHVLDVDGMKTLWALTYQRVIPLHTSMSLAVMKIFSPMSYTRLPLPLMMDLHPPPSTVARNLMSSTLMV
jgi:hypothetical protein